jgi:hypothetical protein
MTSRISSSSRQLPIVPTPDTIDKEPLSLKELDLEDQDITEYNKNDSYDEKGANDHITSGGKDDATGVDDDDAIFDVAVTKIDGSNHILKDTTNTNQSKKKCLYASIIALVLVLAVVIGVVVGTKEARQADTTNPSSGINEDSVASSYICSTTSSTCASVTNVNGTFVSQAVGATMRGDELMDLFGMALSVNCDGSMIAVGSSQHDNRSGYVKVYHWVSTTATSSVEDMSSNSGNANTVGDWVQLGQTLLGNLGSPDQFGHSVSLSANGLRLAVGGRFAGTTLANGTVVDNVGSVQVFELSGNHFSSDTQWEPVGQVLVGEAGDDQSGRSIQLNWDGTRLAVGASGNDETASDAGHVRVYEWVDSADITNSWLQLGSDIDGEAEGDTSGCSVSLSADGSVVAVGAYKNDVEDSIDAGHVRVFVYNDDQQDWVQLGSDIDGSENGDWTGLAMALSGDGTRIVIGAEGNNMRFLPGVSRVYDFINGTEWVQVGDDLQGGGYAVDISFDGRRVAIGSNRGADMGANTGQILVYEYTGEGGATSTSSSSFEWTSILASSIIGDQQGSMFGSSVVLSSDGSRLVGAAPASSGNSTDASVEYVGSVSTYDLCPMED